MHFPAVTENDTFQTILVGSAHYMFFTTMRYINRRFTYLLTSVLCNGGITDLSDVCTKLYGQFNNITSVLGKQSNEMLAVHLV